MPQRRLQPQRLVGFGIVKHQTLAGGRGDDKAVDILGQVVRDKARKRSLVHGTIDEWRDKRQPDPGKPRVR